MEKMSQAMEKMRMLVGIEVEEEQQHADEESSFAFMDDFNRNCTLSTKQRLYGFAICLVAGLTCTLMSMLVFFNPIKFGVAFTFGNLLSLGRFVLKSFALYSIFSFFLF
ncbi:putative vesicle transport protein SFT2 [Helianthus annuus]|nr:putative vesicle transport protein SFT2 [Helianthus annuus]